VPGARTGDVNFGNFLGLVHGATEYQVLVTFTKGAWRLVAGLTELTFSIVNSKSYSIGEKPP
jgi:hypothetical protein